MSRLISRGMTQVIMDIERVAVKCHDHTWLTTLNSYRGFFRGIINIASMTSISNGLMIMSSSLSSMVVISFLMQSSSTSKASRSIPKQTTSIALQLNRRRHLPSRRIPLPHPGQLSPGRFPPSDGGIPGPAAGRRPSMAFP